VTDTCLVKGRAVFAELLGELHEPVHDGLFTGTSRGGAAPPARA
jgi:hypothetical protein